MVRKIEIAVGIISGREFSTGDWMLRNHLERSEEESSLFETLGPALWYPGWVLFLSLLLLLLLLLRLFLVLIWHLASNPTPFYVLPD